ncbi:DUF5681 domain-containing protein [Mesorhizobium sp. RSR565B]|uniref:DUF5681 domain-containing protein n=1 Tax=Mesorhizobium sp. L103C565B0 TaxID=1287094 RepID=UPI0003D04A85|nr:DUF5681 domain-containing protein [Mesorhizobium sp. L103C565B0]ESZ50444.1 hypothetical protein X730_12025 [Mesorhizobium sp. L103C565B0]
MSKFKPGQSGNPKGRPLGSRPAALVALEALAEGEAEAIVRAMIEKAKEGDAVAARPILDRIWPPRKGARVQFDLPVVTGAADLPAAMASINRQVADGEISPEEGAIIAGLLDVQRKAIEAGDIAARLDALEAKLGAR